jgi:hypothetical protein
LSYASSNQRSIATSARIRTLPVCNRSVGQTTTKFETRKTNDVLSFAIFRIG